MKPANEILSGYGTTIFTVMSALAQEHDAINLGQGFPDWEGPEDMRERAARAILEGPNQYPPMLGIPALRQAVAAHDKRFYGLDVDWRSEVMVTSGATEALTASLLALLNPGDEAVLIEPVYDSYPPIVRLSGATAKLVPLTTPGAGRGADGWELPLDLLEDAFSERTKLIVINTPMNPTGKVFSRAELEAIAGLLDKYDAYAICDEVYEHLVFDGGRHEPLMTLPGMRERCVRIGSAGKTFSLTGWKVGYITAPPPLLDVISKAHQFLTFTTPPNLQAAVAYGLAKDDSYFRDLAASMERKRDLLTRGLRSVGFEVFGARATYFLTTNFRALGFNGTDEEFCRHITVEAGVAAIPVSSLYMNPTTRDFARFCFCKEDQVLEQAVERLARHFGAR